MNPVVGPETFFKELIERISGYETPDHRLIFIMNNEKVAELDRTAKGDVLWLHWSIFYLPFLQYYQMKESEVTRFIMKQLDVQFVGRYPSLMRVILAENMENHMHLFDLLDSGGMVF